MLAPCPVNWGDPHCPPEQLLSHEWLQASEKQQCKRRCALGAKPQMQNTPCRVVHFGYTGLNKIYWN